MDAPSLAVGSAVGRYRIRSFQAAGGMGEVYLAWDGSLDRPVALKILPRHRLHDARSAQRFLTEAKAASALNHPAIVTIYETGDGSVAGGGPGGVSFDYIAMEWIDGETLGDAYCKDPSLAVRLGQLARIAEGLGRAHGRGIIHRDLKPDNIMISADGHPKILDFGVAKLVDPGEPVGGEAVRRTLTEPHALVGTVGYMSPEQIEGLPVDHRTDIFSLGCILYECVTGESPFAGSTTAETLHNIVHRDPPRISLSDRALSSALQRIIDHCIHKDREQRYDSARDLALELHDAAAAAARVRDLRVTRRARRGPLARAAAVAVVILGGLLFLAPAWSGVRSIVSITRPSDETETARLARLLDAERRRNRELDQEAARRDAEIERLQADREQGEQRRDDLEDAYRKLLTDLNTTLQQSTAERSQMLSRVAEAEAELKQFREERVRRAAEQNQLREIERELIPVVETRRDARGVVVTIPGVLFQTGDSVIAPESHGILRRIAERLLAYPALRVAVEGHTDARGSASRNLRLSQARAEGIRDFLVIEGVDPARITAIGRGESAPAFDDDDGEGGARNRRIEVILSL